MYYLYVKLVWYCSIELVVSAFLFDCFHSTMNFVTPQQYTKSNLAHYKINTNAVNDFVQIYPSLGPQDR